MSVSARLGTRNIDRDKRRNASKQPLRARARSERVVGAPAKRPTGDKLREGARD